MVLADKFIKNILNIKYVIELKEKLHNFSLSKNEKAQNQNRLKNKELIEKLNIKYGGKYLYEAFDPITDGTQFHLTFKAKNIYRANEILKVKISKNFQRNKSYIYEDIEKEDYNNVHKLIIDSIKNKKLEKFNLDKISNQSNNLNKRKTFIDFTMTNNNEQIFTNMLSSMFSYKNVFNYFCKEFIYKKINDIDVDNVNFKVNREVNISGGRIDILALSNQYDVIIENKIHSGLNGIKSDDHCSQLKTYYDEIYKRKNKKPICFVLVPNYKKEDILNEIIEFDKEMINIFRILTYKDIYDFLNKMINQKVLDSNYVYFKYLDDLLESIKKHSLTLKEFYIELFKEAINKN